MTLVSGPLKLVTDEPMLVSEVWVRAEDPRISGGGLVGDTNATVPIPDDQPGWFEHELLPGPAVLTLVTAGNPGLTVKIVVPDLEESPLSEVREAALIADDATKRELERLSQQVIEDRNTATGAASSAADSASAADGSAQAAAESATNAATSEGDAETWAQISEDAATVSVTAATVFEGHIPQDIADATARAEDAEATAVDAAAEAVPASMHDAQGIVDRLEVSVQELIGLEYRDRAEAAASTAVSARDAAQQARQGAESARDTAEGHKQSAQQAAGTAAKDAADAARTEVEKLKGDAPEAFDTLGEIADELKANQTERAALTNQIASKSDTTYVDQQVGARTTPQQVDDKITAARRPGVVHVVEGTTVPTDIDGAMVGDLVLTQGDMTMHTITEA